jgi:uncharacterized protein
MTTLVLIAKECVPGRVKTRLHPPFSLADAARIAAACLADTLAAVNGLPFDRRVLFFDGVPPEDLPQGWEIVPQPPGSLDTRIGAIFDACTGPTLLIGMDTPHLDPGILRPFAGPWQASVDTVIGHATDGGFWTLGMRDPDGDLVRGVPMSRADTGAIQEQRLRLSSGLDVLRLPVLTDIDTAADLADAARSAPRLRSVLDDLRAEVLR